MRHSSIQSRNHSKISCSSITIVERNSLLSILNLNSPSPFPENSSNLLENPTESPFIQDDNPPIEKVDSYNILLNLLPNIFNQLMHFLVNIIFGHFLGSVNDIPLFVR